MYMSTSRVKCKLFIFPLILLLSHYQVTEMKINIKLGSRKLTGAAQHLVTKLYPNAAFTGACTGKSSLSLLLPPSPMHSHIFSDPARIYCFFSCTCSTLCHPRCASLSRYVYHVYKPSKILHVLQKKKERKKTSAAMILLVSLISPCGLKG